MVRRSRHWSFVSSVSAREQENIWKYPPEIYKVQSPYEPSDSSGRAYPGFSNMKRLVVFLLPPGWDASPSQGYPRALKLPVTFYTPGLREASWEWCFLPKITIQWPQPGHEPRAHAPGGIFVVQLRLKVQLILFYCCSLRIHTYFSFLFINIYILYFKWSLHK